jgi:hypothetical protein
VGGTCLIVEAVVVEGKRKAALEKVESPLPQGGLITFSPLVE